MPLGIGERAASPALRRELDQSMPAVREPIVTVGGRARRVRSGRSSSARGPCSCRAAIADPGGPR